MIQLLREKGSKEEIIHIIQSVQSGKKNLREADIWQLMNQAEKYDDFPSDMLSTLYIWLAKSRFERIGFVDAMTNEWLEHVDKIDSTSQEVLEMYVEQLFSMLKKLPIPTRFQPIRETDNSVTKKETASNYFKMIADFDHQLHDIQNAWNKVSDRMISHSEDSRIEQVRMAMEQVNSLEEMLHKLKKTTKRYLDSLQGIYHSVQLYGELLNMIKQIETTSQKWHDLMRNVNEEQHVSAINELENMVGLEEVKKRIKKLYQYLDYQQERIKKGYQSKDGLNLHMILTGNPGTGKTHLARLIAKIYYELGLLQRPDVLEVDRSQLVGAYVGQTEEQTMKLIEQANGGVLFIDEAYSLKRSGVSANDYGQTAIDTLVAAMTGPMAGSFAVVLAGYPVEMRAFLRANPGLRSRFPEHNMIHIEDYSIDELLEIGEMIAVENDFLLTTEATYELQKRLEKAKVDDSFGNARTTKSFILEAIFQKGAKVSIPFAEADDFVLLHAEDFQTDEKRTEEKRALDELNDMVGLDHVKEEIHSLASFVRIQQRRREEGLQTLPLELHSVFTGEPGTGKTTVAKLFSKALNELDLLKRGHVVVVSRADLVAGYIGQTAEKTKEKVKDALGGVLFIDEAYSLLSGGQGDYGKEVIQTLVQEMTENEENLVVIMAGYEREMNELLDSNPGLRSRFKKTVHFHPYTADELMEIVEKNAKETGYFLTKEAKKKMRILLDEAHTGQARFAVDRFKQAVQSQSVRLSASQALTKEALMTITEEDI